MSGKRRGPAPKPAAVKKAKGNSGRRPIPQGALNEEEILAQDVGVSSDPTNQSTSDVTPPKPDFLTDRGVGIWESLAPKLAMLQLLKNVDAMTFARYCNDFADWIRAKEDIDANGLTYESESPHGTYRRANPAVALADRMNRTLLQFESNFGLNPADRQRLYAGRAMSGGAGAGSRGPSVGEGGAVSDNGELPLGGGPVGLLN